jgi:hypothetical protein
MKIQSAILILLAAVYFDTSARAQQPLPLDKIMSKEDQQAIGVPQMSDAQRAALERWATGFALQVVAASNKKAGGAYAGATDGHWVKSKIDGGKIIQLEDGSMWQISPIDKIETTLWLPTEGITIIESKNPTFPYKLINGDGRSSAEAKFISK